MWCVRRVGSCTKCARMDKAPTRVRPRVGMCESNLEVLVGLLRGPRAPPVHGHPGLLHLLLFVLLLWCIIIFFSFRAGGQRRAEHGHFHQRERHADLLSPHAVRMRLSIRPLGRLAQRQDEQGQLAWTSPSSATNKTMMKYIHIHTKPGERFIFLLSGA